MAFEFRSALTMIGQHLKEAIAGFFTSPTPGSLQDFLCITAAGLIGGSLHLFQQPSATVFETSFVSSVCASLAFGAVGSWVGVVVILGTSDRGSGQLRRFTLGVMFGFAGTLALDTALQAVGLSNAKQIAERQQKNDEEVARVLKLEASDSKAGVAGTNYQDRFNQLRSALADRLALVCASNSDETRALGYFTVSSVIEAMCADGATDLDTQLTFVTELSNNFCDPKRTPYFGFSLRTRVAAHLERLKGLKRQLNNPLPKTFELRGKVSALDEGNVSHHNDSYESSKASSVDSLCSLTVERHTVSSMLVMADTSVRDSLDPIEQPIVIDGFVRLANRASSDALWTDVLLLPPDPDKASSFLIELNRLRPQDTQKIADLLLGTKTLKAKTDIFVRGSYPVKAANGIVFSKEIGVLPAGTSVEVMDSQTFTTDVSHFSQIWIAYKDLGPH